MQVAHKPSSGLDESLSILEGTISYLCPQRRHMIKYNGHWSLPIELRAVQADHEHFVAFRDSWCVPSN